MNPDATDTHSTLSPHSEADTHETDRADYVRTDQLSEFEGSELPTAAYSESIKEHIEAEKAQDFTGRKIGPYRLVDELGRGGMGVVYKAIRDDGELRMTAAVKLIRRSLVDPEIVERFKRERQLLADLRHPHIAPLLDAGTTEDGLPYFIMDFVDGMTIDKWCFKNKLGLEELLRLFRKVLAAVALAHRKGVIHRDIKPGNVLVTTEGEPILLDFGIAHTVNADDDLAEGRVGMTPAYAAPEQIRGKPATPRFDIFALGLLLLEMRTGTRARRGNERVEDQIHLLSTGVLSTSEATLDIKSDKESEAIQTQIPEELAELLVAALAEDPDKRYATCEQMLADLDYLLASLVAGDSSSRTTRSNTLFHDAILLYSQEESATAHLLAKKLQERGVDLILAHEGEQADKVATSLAGTRCCLICKGQKSSGPWVQSLLKETISQRVRRAQLRVLPVLLPQARRPRRESKLPSFLRRRSWIQIKDHLSDSQQLNQLADQILGRETEMSSGMESEICPFRGLEVFREEDRRFFFGREAVTERLADHMDHNRFLAVLGPSGSGKSSVVQAGLMPHLREQGYALTMFTPTTHPLLELATALNGLFAERSDPHPLQQIKRRLRQDDRALSFLTEELKGLGGSRKLCIVIDQFEEVFTLAKGKDEVRRFIGNLLVAVESEQAHVSIVITLRSDFLGKCVAYPDLNRYIVDHLDQLEAMTREESEQAIAEPARLVGLRFEGGLLKRILDDLAGQSSDLPLLEHALLELYQRRRGRLLTATAYNDIGGIEGALARRAEQTYNALDDEGRQVLRKMFTLCLVTPGEGAEDTRRRATRDELLAVGGNTPEVTALLDTLINARLLTSHRDLHQDLEHVDVAHEALIRKWDRIKTWMAEDRETARLLGRLRRRAQSWQESAYHQDHLLRGALLIQMEELVQEEGNHVGDLAQSFIVAGQKQREVEQRQQRRRAQGTVLAAVAIAIITFVLFLNARDAESEARHSETLALQAESRASAKTRESNYNLSMAFNERAGIALDKGNPREAWLGALAALAQDIPSDRDQPEARGRFLDSRMSNMGRLLWTSPTAPKLARVTASQDGKYLALAGQDPLIYLMDTTTGRQHALFSSASDSILDLEISPDNKWLAASTQGQDVHIWDIQKQGIHTVISNHQHTIQDLAFDRLSKTLASVDEEGQLLIHHLDEQTLTRYQLSQNTQAITFGSDNVQIYFASPLGVAAFRFKDQQRQNYLTSLQSQPTALSWNEGFGLISGWSQGEIVFHQSDQKSLIGKTRHKTAVQQIATSPDSTRVLSTNGQETLLWENTHQNAQVMDDFTDLTSLSLSNQGQINASDNKGRLHRFDLEHQKELPGMIGHDAGACSARFSPNGKLIATGSLEGQILLWDAQNQRPPITLNEHQARVYAVDFSPDGQWLASASFDKTIRLWHLDKILNNPAQRAKSTLTLEGHDEGLFRVEFSPNGQQLASVSVDTTVRLWDLKGLYDQDPVSYQPGPILRGHKAMVFEGNYAPDGRYLISSSADNTLRLWDLQAREPKTIQVLEGHTARIYGVSFSRDATLIVSVSYDQTARVWEKVPNKARYRLRQILRHHTAPITGVSFSKDGRFLATAADDQTVNVWKLATLAADPQPVTTLRGHTGGIFGVSFAPDGNRIVTASDDHTIRLWDIEDLNQEKQKDLILKGHKAPVYSVAINADTTKLASTSFDKTVQLWDLSNLDHSITLEGHSGGVFCAVFSPDQETLATSSDDATVRFWDLKGEEAPLILRGHDMSIYGIDYSPDGKRFATTSEDRTIKIWDTHKLSQLHDQRQPQAEFTLHGHTDVIYSATFSPDGRYLASGSWDHDVRLWNLLDQSSHVFEGHGEPVMGIDFSPDGRLIASGSWDNTVRIWDTTQQNAPKVLRGHTNRVSGVAFSSDGRWLASISDDQTTRIWRLSDYKTEMVLYGHSDKLGWYTSFAPNGQFLATPSDDQTVRIWQMDKMLLPPHDSNSQAWYQELLKRSLYFMAYRSDGFQLIPEPHTRLGHPGQELAPSPYDHLDRVRPNNQNLADWLMQGWQSKKP